MKNTSTRASMFMASLKRSVLQMSRMGPMRKCGNALGERARKSERGLMILKPRGAGAQVATHSHLPRVWREAGMEGRKRS